MDHFIDTKIPKMGIFVDKNSQNDQTPFPKIGRKTPAIPISWASRFYPIRQMHLITYYHGAKNL